MKSKPRIYKELIAPNGKKSNLTPEQYKLVRSKAFKDWFGDWENDPANASKVVDENGEPLVVYHGAYVENPFYIFDFNKADLGFHFGTYEQAKNRSETKLFFKGRKSIVAAFFLNIKTIFEATDIGEWEYPQRYIDMFVSDGLISESDAKKNGFYRLVQKEENKPIREYLLNKYGKFVGFVYNNKYEGKGKSFIVLNPSQIKLADGTNTTFDSSNPDIRFNNGGSINQAKSDLDSKYELLIETFRSKGYDIAEGANSKTNFGHSRYFYVNFENRLADNFGKGLKARVSDHSVSNSHRLLNEFHFGNSKNIDSLEKENVARIEYYLRPEKFTIVPHKTEWEEEYVVGGNEVKPTDVILESLGKSKRGLEKFRIKRKKYAITTYIEDKETKKQYRYENGGEMKSMKHGTITEGKMEGKIAEGGMAENLEMYINYESSKPYEYDKVTNLNTLKALQKKGFIEFNDETGKRSVVNNPEYKWNWGKEKYQISKDDIALAIAPQFTYKNVQYFIGYSQGRNFLKFYVLKKGEDWNKYNSEGKMANGGLVAPNGKKSNLNAEQYKLVRTKAFKDWFGDWENDPTNASKVVDENGEPLMVYHNSDSMFNEFDLSYFGKSDGGYAGVGFYFATKSIKGYGKYEYQCFLSIKNPFIRTNNNWKDSFMPYSWIPNRANEKNESSIRNASKEWTSKAKEIGYNGFIDEGGEIVAFYPNQIKLADGTNTTFDGSNPDIRYNNGGKMKSMKHGTITEGASHDDGGIKVLNKSTNQILEVEGGEGVVNKHSMASDKKVKLNGKEMTICEAVSQLNQMDGNGVKFDCDKVEHRQFIEKMDLGGELEKGIRTEQEHIQTLKELYSKQITPEQASEKIAKEHLAENPAYYSKLQAIEQSKKNNADLIMKLGGMTNEHIYTFEDFGLIKDFKENPFHKLAEMLKKSNNFCDVEPKYCVTSLDIDRKDMPQVYEEFIPDYVDFLDKQGIDSQMKYNVQVSDLKPTQKNISVERISKILHRLLSGYYTGENGQLLNPLKRVVIATKDGYLLDGHHRWATSLFLSPKNTITVLEINADIADLIPITKGFKKTEYQEFMFGGRVEVLDKTSSTPEAIKTFTAFKGGFPQKGLVVSPLLVYEGNSIYKFVEDGFMIEISSRSLQDYIKASTLSLANYLRNNLQKTSGEKFYAQGLGTNRYFDISLGTADYSFFRKNDIGTIAVSKKGGSRFIFFVPSESQLGLLNEERFLDDFLQALNLLTKTPNAPVKVPQPKTKKTSIQSINAPKKQQTIDPSTIVKFDTEKFDNQIIAIQNLMESFTEDEIEARRYLQNEIDKLRGEKEKKLNESLFTTNFTGLLDLYASKVSLQQLPLKKNPCNLTTPSGAPSELDMLQYSIVRTPAFKNWFGDWEEAFKSKNYNGVSKAINERTGEPLVMYHGKSFMKTEMTSFSTPINVNFPIKYFAEESNYSAYFADLDNSKQSLSAIFEFFIRCVNPMDFTSIGTEPITPEIFRKVVEAIYGYEIKSPMIMEGVPQKVWQILRGNVPMLNEIRQNTNFDGFKLYEDNPDAPNKGFAEKTLDFAVYSNTAMKAADGRNTTFLKDVESFRFEQGGLVNN